MKNPEAQKLGSLGGKARAKKYSKSQLKEWAKKGGRPKSKCPDCGKRCFVVDSSKPFCRAKGSPTPKSPPLPTIKE